MLHGPQCAHSWQHIRANVEWWRKAAASTLRVVESGWLSIRVALASAMDDAIMIHDRRDILYMYLESLLAGTIYRENSGATTPPTPTDLWYHRTSV